MRPMVANRGVELSLALARKLAIDEHVLPDDPNPVTPLHSKRVKAEGDITDTFVELSSSQAVPLPVSLIAHEDFGCSQAHRAFKKVVDSSRSACVHYPFQYRYVKRHEY